MQMPSLPAIPLMPRLPHQLMQQRITQFYDDEIRSRYFRGLDFAGPQGDPGWFGPGSAVWYVHSHLPALVFGSCHGEMEIAVAQMEMFQEDKGLLSPARFKNSVHNTGAGMFSIAMINKRGGAGKTTAMKMLCGLSIPSSGTANSSGHRTSRS